VAEIRTPRLRLVRGTPAHLRAELESPAALARALGVDVAESWPPELYDADATRWMLQWLEAHPNEAEWGFYYVVEADADQAIGAGGFKGAPDESGTVEIGYSIVPERRRRGFAREAVNGWLEHAFADPRVTRVIAHTLADLEPSIGVLRSVGFRFVGGGDDPEEPSAVQYEITRIEHFLATARASLVASVMAVREDLRRRRPGPARWSIAEVLEHLARVESGVTKLLTLRGRERPVEPVDTANAQLTPERIARLRDREKRLEAPDRIRPTGTIELADALRNLHDARTALLDAYRSADPAALDGQVHTHQNVGPLTLRGWVEFVAHHEARHVDQIREIAAELAVGTPS
jgi:ribosomal-protein-alanine N-acetyltransferase